MSMFHCLHPFHNTVVCISSLCYCQHLLRQSTAQTTVAMVGW